MTDYVADLTASIETELEALNGFLSALVEQPRFVQLEPTVIRTLPEQFHRLDAIRDAVRDLVFFGDVLDETRREVDRALGQQPEATAPDFEAEEEEEQRAGGEETQAAEPELAPEEEPPSEEPAPPPSAGSGVFRMLGGQEPVSRSPSSHVLQALTTRQYDLCAIWS